MSRQHFGTDGIRGTVGQSPITPDFMLRLGHAVGGVLRREIQRPTVLIGKDTRLSGYMIESALQAGFFFGRCRRLAHRAFAHSGRGLPHASASRGFGGGHQCISQPLQ